jgi:hypothetical protein
VSSTNRGGERSEADDYPTPEWAVLRFLESYGAQLPGGPWLEPAAGDGAIIRAVNTWRAQTLQTTPGIEWSAAELRPSCEPLLDALVRPPGGVFIGDFLTAPSPGRFSVAITNPPFRLARDFAEKCLSMADYVVLLLRLNFLGSGKRHEWMQANLPDIHVLPDRPSFRGDNKTDSIEYGWFVWGPENRSGKRSSSLYLLDRTPKAVRKPARVRAPRVRRVPVPVPVATGGENDFVSGLGTPDSVDPADSGQSLDIPAQLADSPE